MKKLFVVIGILASMLSFSSANAQSDSFELGVRFGGLSDQRASIDLILPLGMNRIHGDLTFGDGWIGAECLYDWQYAFGDGNFIFYPGIGGAVAIADESLNIAFEAEVGVEYAFPFPMTLGLDIRPAIWLLNDANFNVDNLALCVRYRFQ